MVLVPKKATIERKNALIVGAESNLHSIIKNLINTYDWNIEFPSCSAEQAIGYLNETKVNALIILDSPAVPAAESVRILRRDLRAIITPTMCILGNISKAEQDLFSKIHRLEVVCKPITTSTFYPIFKQMIKTWELPAMRALQQYVSKSNNDNRDVTIQILTKLLEVPETSALACMTLLHLHGQAGNYLEAETMLVATFKKSPSSPALLAICGWFYLDAKIPAHALRFLEKIKQLAPRATLLNLDIASANIATGNYDAALLALLDWDTANTGNELVPNYIARLALATGRQNSLSASELSPLLLRKVSEQWALTIGRADAAVPKPGPAAAGAAAAGAAAAGPAAGGPAPNLSPRKDAS